MLLLEDVPDFTPSTLHDDWEYFVSPDMGELPLSFMPFSGGVAALVGQFSSGTPTPWGIRLLGLDSDGTWTLGARLDVDAYINELIAVASLDSPYGIVMGPHNGAPGPDVSLQAFTVTSPTTGTIGPRFDMGGSSLAFAGIVRLSSTQALIINGATAYVVSISGDTITAVTSAGAYTSHSGALLEMVTRVSDTTALVLYHQGDVGTDASYHSLHTVVITVSGTTITTGTDTNIGLYTREGSFGSVRYIAVPDGSMAITADRTSGGFLSSVPYVLHGIDTTGALAWSYIGTGLGTGYGTPWAGTLGGEWLEGTAFLRARPTIPSADVTGIEGWSMDQGQWWPGETRGLIHDNGDQTLIAERAFYPHPSPGYRRVCDVDDSGTFGHEYWRATGGSEFFDGAQLRYRIPGMPSNLPLTVTRTATEVLIPFTFGTVDHYTPGGGFVRSEGSGGYVAALVLDGVTYAIGADPFPIVQLPANTVVAASSGLNAPFKLGPFPYRFVAENGALSLFMVGGSLHFIASGVYGFAVEATAGSFLTIVASSGHPRIQRLTANVAGFAVSTTVLYTHTAVTIAGPVSAVLRQSDGKLLAVYGNDVWSYDLGGVTPTLLFSVPTTEGPAARRVLWISDVEPTPGRFVVATGAQVQIIS